MGRRRDLPDLLQLSILRGRGEDHTGLVIIGFNHRSFEVFFTDISMRSDTAVFVKAFSFLRLLTGRGSSNGSAEIFHRRKRKSSFDEKTPLFRGFYAPRLPELEEGVWGVGEIAGIPREENPLPFFPPFLLSQTFFLLLARLCPPLNLKFFRQVKLFRVRRLPWNPGLNHLKNVLI